MTLGLRGRMAVTAMTAAAVSLLAVPLLVTPGLRERSHDQTRETLLAEARLMAHLVQEPLLEGADSARLDPLVDRAARDVGARVTVVALDGRVLADSALSGAALRAVENHGARPEVQAALRAGSGTAVRRSTTVNRDLLYAAVPVRRDGRLLGVVRVARALEATEAQVASLRRSVAFALVLAFVLAAALAVALSAPLAAPFRQITDVARRFADGDFGARARLSRRDEVGQLSRILDQSADQLQARLTELARDRARTEAILSAMADGVLAVDHGGVVIVANDALRLALGLDDAVGRHYLEVVRQKEVAEVLEEVLRRQERCEGEVTLRHVRRTFGLAAVPFPAEEGRPPGAVLSFHDVTERRRLEQVRRDFVANASHELRTPLTSIRGFVEALEDGALTDGPTALRFLGKIRTHADRMAALVSDLLELSRLESGERPPQWEEVDVGEVAREAAASLGPLAEGKGIALAVRAHTPAAVRTDPERLRRILENLLENAIKYTASGGRVEIMAEKEAAGAAVEVADNGPGIPAEHLPRIFERFYRVDKARSREMGGTGLGLSIVKHLAEGMGATVAVQSELGAGTRFRVRLPAKAAVPRASIASSP
jgi:two-component system phosphate regulon sensor histidine kinase PhoR